MQGQNLAESLMDACFNKGTAQHQEAERTSDVFQTVLTDVNLNSDIFLRIWRSRSQDNMVHTNSLYRSNLTFSGLIRGTQGDHAERCANL